MTGSTKVFQQGDIVETRHTITGLEYDTEYEVKLFAVNKQGDSEPDVRTFKTKTGMYLYLTGSARVFGYSVFRGVLNRVYGILQLKYGYSVYHFL